MTAKALTPIAAWFRSSRRMLAAELSQGGWLNFGTFRWSDADVPRALRAGAGMITPLVLGLATGHLEYGVYAALGALPAGMVSFQGASRTRVTAVVLAAVGMAVATFTGGVAAYVSGWLLFPAVLIFSYLSGLLATLGQRFQVVGLQWAMRGAEGGVRGAPRQRRDIDGNGAARAAAGPGRVDRRGRRAGLRPAARVLDRADHPHRAAARLRVDDLPGRPARGRHGDRAGLGVATALLLHVGTAAVVAAAAGVTMTIAYASPRRHRRVHRRPRHRRRPASPSPEWLIINTSLQSLWPFGKFNFVL